MNNFQLCFTYNNITSIIVLEHYHPWWNKYWTIYRCIYYQFIAKKTKWLWHNIM